VIAGSSGPDAGARVDGARQPTVVFVAHELEDSERFAIARQSYDRCVLSMRLFPRRSLARLNRQQNRQK
jgi:hypothetical protein